MPELPEVEVVRRGLAPAVTGATVAGAEVLDPRSVRRHPGVDFEAEVAGARLAAPERRGKFLWVPFADGRGALLAHLGMSGQLLLRTPDAPDDRHLRVRLWLARPAGEELRVDFVDQRIFGSLAVDRLVDGVPTQAAHIALDPLDARFDVEAFVHRIRARRSTVKRALLDQTLVSGIGNIYADEALWAARIHPEQATGRLSAPAARRLIAEVRAVMLRALAEGGTSFDAQYVNVNGQAGYFSRSLHVYGRQGQPCDRCDTTIVRESFMNRGSHFCPRCQRRPSTPST